MESKEYYCSREGKSVFDEFKEIEQKHKEDMVNKPAHYQGKVECIDAIESSLGVEGFKAYLQGTALKYTFRMGRKNIVANQGQEDCRKAIWYLNKYLEVDGE